jgi:serine/threonine protein phosphatase PrpC
VSVEVGFATDIGKVREGNEDSLLVDHPLYAVADGMGGAKGGEVASRIAVETLEELAHKGEGSLRDQVRRANELVFERSTTDRQVAGMGTTLTAVVIEGGTAHLAHVGDSRAYLLRAGDLRQLTDDHTLVQRMVKAGEITRDEAEVHPHRNVIIRAIGIEPDVEVDETTVALLDGDRIVLCSDGLTAMVAEQQLQAILETEPDPKRAADRLVRAANRAGGVDNITVVVIDVHDVAGEEESEARGSDVPSSDRSPGSRLRKAASGRGPQARRWALRGGIALLVLAVMIVALRVYADRQWYVGDNEGHVAVFQGIPAEIGAVRFSHVAVEFPDLQTSAVEQSPLYADLGSGITVDSREEALAIVAQMRSDAGNLVGSDAVEPSPSPSAKSGGGA